MANIPVYDPSAQIGQGFSIPTQGAEAFGQAGYHVARIAHQIGEDASVITNQLETQEGMDQLTTHNDNLQKLDATIRGDGPGSWNEAKGQGVSADAYISGTVQPGLDALDEGLTNKKARYAAIQARNSTLIGYTKEFHAEQNQIDGDNAASVASSAIRLGSNQLLSDPTNLGSQLKSVTAQVDGLQYVANLPPGKRVEMRKQISDELTSAAIDGWVSKATNNPNTTPAQVDAIRQIFTDPNGEFASAPTAKLNEALEKLARVKDTSGAVQGYQAEQELADVNKAIRDTGPTQELLARQAALTPLIQGTTAAETADKQFKTARDNESAVAFGQTAKEVMTAPSTDLKPAVDAVATALGKATDPDQLRQLEAKRDALNQAIVKRDKEYNADPVAYTQKYSPTVAAATQAFSSNPTPETFGAYATVTIAEQRRLEPYRVPALLPKQEMDRVGSALANSRTAENGAASATSVLQNEAALTGRYWPQAANEMLHSHVINEPQFLAGQLFGKPGASGLAQELMQVSMMKTEELETGNKLSLKQANASAAKAIQPLLQTLAPQTGGRQLADSYQNGIASLLLSRAKVAGAAGNPDSDATAIARQMIMGDYTFSGTLRIPNGAGDAGLIESGTGAVQADLKNHNLVIPPSFSGLRPGPQHDDYLLALQAHGQWVTNGDESGAFLLDPQGNQVTEMKGGHAVPLELKWGDLAKLATPAARTINKVSNMTLGNAFSGSNPGVGPIQ